MTGRDLIVLIISSSRMKELRLAMAKEEMGKFALCQIRLYVLKKVKRWRVMRCNWVVIEARIVIVKTLGYLCGWD